jgi:hypothetical protein
VYDGVWSKQHMTEILMLNITNRAKTSISFTISFILAKIPCFGVFLKHYLEAYRAISTCVARRVALKVIAC